MDKFSLSADYIITFPDWELFVALSIVIVIDFITGIIKAKFLNIVRTSTALKRTTQKITQYFSTIAVVWFICNLVQYDTSGLNWFSKYIWWIENGVVIFMIYIELLSILENSIAVDKESRFAKLLTIPMHKILTAQTEKNPFYMYTKEQQVTVELEKLQVSDKVSKMNKKINSENYGKSNQQNNNKD